jgi:hypothetical protein
MEGRLPHQVIYDTPNSVPIADVIDSLRGTMIIAQEIGPLLEILIPGLSVTEVRMTVTDISQASPLREAFTIGLVAVYQDKIATDMPKILHDLFGTTITPPTEYDNLISLLLIVLVFYSGSFMLTAAEKLLQRPKTQRQLDGLIGDVAKILEKDEHYVREALERKYHKVGISNLLSASLRFLAPSKNQNNAALTVNGRHFSRDLVAEFPGQAQIKALKPGPSIYPLENVEIQFHAQDIDRNRQGWAAVVPALSTRRLPLSLVPPMLPAEIYNLQVIHGDIMVEALRDDDGDTKPVRIHLIRIRAA